MAAEQGNGGILERTAGFFERLHKAIGAVAIGGAVLFESTGLAVFGALEFAHGALLGWVKNRVGKKPQPTPAVT